MTNETVEERSNDVGAIVIESIGLVAQLGLVALGVWFFVDDANDLDALVSWCFIGSCYLAATIVVLNLAVHRPELAGRRRTRRFLAHPVMRTIASVLTFSASAVGVLAATLLIVLRNDPELGPFVEIFAVWAMLVAWGLFHWGWARIFYARYYSAGPPPLEFPRTAEPGLIDFVYFSFTNATNFSVSDVLVTTTRMRWSVVWHTSLSFFFNALIIVLAINTITGIDIDPSLLEFE